MKGLQSVTFTLNGLEFTHAFPVCALAAEAAGLLGTDLFEKAGTVIDFECSHLFLTGIGNVPRVLSVPHAGHAALAIFNNLKLDAAPRSVRRRRGVQQTRSQPAPTLRLRGSKEVHGLLELGRTLF